jgi:DNA topoisomerase-1
MGVTTPSAAAIPGLVRSDPHGPGISRARGPAGFRYLGPSGAEITDAGTLDRIRALRVPPAWELVWISPGPLGHIQATGVDGKGRIQYLYHQRWRAERDAQKFSHMLRFASALPELRTATVGDLNHRGLAEQRVAAGVVRLIDLGLFRIGGEKYAELDHHYGATTLQKRHVRLTRHGVMFDYVAKAGKERTIAVRDPAVLPVMRALPDPRRLAEGQLQRGQRRGLRRGGPQPALCGGRQGQQEPSRPGAGVRPGRVGRVHGGDQG